MKRSPMNRATPGALEWSRKRRKPMSRESTKGRAERLRWQGERDEHLASQPTCQAPLYGLPERCWGTITVHHRKPRGAGGRRGRTGPLVTLCAGHHGYVESHRAEAREKGLLFRPWEGNEE